MSGRVELATGILAITEEQRARKDRYSTENPQLGAAIEILWQEFARFHEKWIVGHKGDQVANLQSIGVLGPNEIDVVHVHSSLGVSAKRSYDPPADQTYEDLVTACDEGMREEIMRVVAHGKRVCVFMPFSNEAFQKMITEAGAEPNFRLTSPVENAEQFLLVENKIRFAEMMDEIIGHDMPENIIKWCIATTNDTYDSLREKVGAKGDQRIYLQKDLSAGGDGTKCIASQEELEELLNDPSWLQYLVEERVKVTAEVMGNYPANGTACIVPNSDGSCKIFVDPPSKKPVGLAELGGKVGSGNGNDWGTPWPSEVQAQYLAIVTRIGEYLYQRYGYTGIFGPDCMVAVEDGKYIIRVNEVNVRWQGTTPYQTGNALTNNRLPLEVIHYLVKLSNGDHTKREIVNEVVGDPNRYNTCAMNETGGFYIKIFPPKELHTVTCDMNGAFIYCQDTGEFIRIDDPSISPLDVYSRNITANIAGLLREYEQNGRRPKLVWVKAPNVGTTIGGGALTPMGYIIGSNDPGQEGVFTDGKPGITDLGKALYTYARNSILSRSSEA